MHYSCEVRRGSLNGTILLNDQTILNESYLKPTDAIWVVNCGNSKGFHVTGPVESLDSQSTPLRSCRNKVVSIQVDSMQIEVVSRHHRSRFDTCRESIRFNSAFRGEGREGSSRPRKFQISIKFRDKSRILLTKMDSCQRKLQFPSIGDHRLCTFVMLCNFELCKGTKSYFSSAKDDQQL